MWINALNELTAARYVFFFYFSWPTFHHIYLKNKQQNWKYYVLNRGGGKQKIFTTL